MDTTKAITHISLCAGYGGIDLGLKRAIPALRTIAFSEIEAFACANLVSKMEAGLLDTAPIWTNLKTFPWEDFRDRVDILSGGYPCQPFSAAGKRQGTNDPRHLWPYIADGIVRMRPRVCFFENVEGHISLGLPDVIEDLAGMGYRTTWGIFSASEVGAPHQRKRVFILAHRNRDGLVSDVSRTETKQIGHWAKNGISGTDGELAHRISARLEGIKWAGTHGEGWEGAHGTATECGDVWPIRHREGCVANAAKQYAQGGVYGVLWRQDSKHGIPCEHRRSSLSFGVWPSRPGEPQYWWEPPRVVGNADSERQQVWSGKQRAGLQGTDADGRADASRQTESPLGRDADGLTHRLDDAVLHVSTDNRTDELRLLGNGVVPATAHKAFITLWKELND